jgi:transketolase
MDHSSAAKQKQLEPPVPRSQTEEMAKRIRRHAVQMTNLGGSSHVGSVLSMADIIAVLYGSIMRIDPTSPNRADRDRFILSKGHAGAGVYAVLAESGFFPLEWLEKHCADGSVLSGHVSHRGVPGVEISTGSLGHGLSVGAGMALGAKLDVLTNRVFVLLSDGECDEGSTWEAAMFAAHHQLDNLIAIVDYNKIQSLASVEDTLGLEPFADKWKAFGWSCAEVDGHNHDSLYAHLSSIPKTAGKPTCLLAHTVKGKGVSFMERSVLWHYRTPRGSEYDDALNELGEE